MALRTCVNPGGKFTVGIHDPGFEVANLRIHTSPASLGRCPDGTSVENHVNFPESTVKADQTDRIYEIANPFPFRGATFINTAWADRHVGRPETISVPEPPACSLSKNLKTKLDPAEASQILDLLPRPLTLALAQASTDPAELSALAQKTCTLLFEGPGDCPTGIAYKETETGRPVPDIHDHEIFDILGNNPNLPDAYKEVMVLRPGVQGNSEIIGEVTSGTHVFEYLRRNSYIPWGHFAANMANDEIRYRAKDLTRTDMIGIRHLYYQRIYVRMADQLNLSLPAAGRALSKAELETLRKDICALINSGSTDGLSDSLNFDAALWGWNFGFGFAQSGHRLHASHQMIHQQNAMIPKAVSDNSGRPFDCFSCGDLIADFIQEYQTVHNSGFFNDYLTAIHNNDRTDQKANAPSSLIVYEDDHVLLFAPKAQISEWELQLITKKRCSHILEADTPTREGLDLAMLKAVQILETLGAQMVTSIEFSGRFSQPDIGPSGSGQHLLYSFIPRLPYAPGTFSEAQLRWISGCYPEDFAQACRRAMTLPPTD